MSIKALGAGATERKKLEKTGVSIPTLP